MKTSKLKQFLTISRFNEKITIEAAILQVYPDVQKLNRRPIIDYVKIEVEDHQIQMLLKHKKSL